MTKQMKARRLPTAMALLIGAGVSFAATPATAQAPAAQGQATQGQATQGQATQGQAAQGAGAQAAAGQGKGDPKAAVSKIGACIGCHAIPGYKSSYPMVYSVPMIRGQSGKYIENALNAYRSGDRDHPTMRAIAGSLSDQDIADLAAYYGTPLEKK